MPTCHTPPQEATKVQGMRQLLLCVDGTGLSPSHAHCFGVPDSAGSPLLMSECQTAVSSMWYCQQTRCCDIVGRNPTLVTSGQRYLSREAACDASHPLVLPESRIWVTCVCRAILAGYDPSYPAVLMLLTLGSLVPPTAGSSGPGAQEHWLRDGGLQEGCQTC